MAILCYYLLLVVGLLAIITSAAELENVTNIRLDKLFENYPNIEVKLLEHKDDNTDKKRANLEVAEAMTPVVFWHGMGDTAFGSIEADMIALQKKYPNIPVFSIQIGSNPMEDALAGYLVNVNYQVAKACEAIVNNTLIRERGQFNAVGFSQGAQFLRAVIQRCPWYENGIRVKNFISLGGQHQGVFGLPNCEEFVFCKYIRHLLTYATYEESVQEHIVQAEYWHDPKREEEYKRKSVFLADINNENNQNEVYKHSILGLDNIVLVKFAQDDMVVPRESSHFGFYAPGQTKNIVPLEETKLYIEDRLGLKRMSELGFLHMIEVPGRHLQYRMKWFIEKIADVYLNNTVKREKLAPAEQRGEQLVY